MRENLEVPGRRSQSHARISDLGWTRVVITDDGVGDERPRGVCRDGSMKRIDRTRLQRLMVYRWGFTQQMARRMLANDKGTYGAGLREWLSYMKNKEALRYISGWYFISPHVQQEAIEDDFGVGSMTNDERAVCHVYAATALAPYSVRQAVPGLMGGEDVLAENVDEARYHIKEARKHLHRTLPIVNEKRRRELQKLQGIQGNVRKFGQVQGWRAVLGGTEARNEGRYAYELATGLLQAREEHADYNGRQDDDPEAHRLTAEAAWVWADERDGNSEPDKKEELYREAEARFCRAIGACNTGGKEAAVRARYAQFLVSREGGDAIRVQEQDAAVIKAYDEWEEISGPWLERQGDRTGRAEDAVWYYDVGVRMTPSWHQLPIKAIGASEYCSREMTQAMEAWLNKPEDELVAAVSKASRGYYKETDRMVCVWWQKGLKVMANRRGGRVADAIREISK